MKVSNQAEATASRHLTSTAKTSPWPRSCAAALRSAFDVARPERCVSSCSPAGTHVCSFIVPASKLCSDIHKRRWPSFPPFARSPIHGNAGPGGRGASRTEQTKKLALALKRQRQTQHARGARSLFLEPDEPRTAGNIILLLWSAAKVTQGLMEA